jgi:hypothetical protein
MNTEIRGVDPGPGPGDLYDARRLAERLGITVTSLRNARLRKTTWLPEPAGILNGAPVWTADSLEGIEGRVKSGGRPPKT